MNKYAAPGVLNAWNVFFVPQSLVDAYYMADGRTINNASEAYPYEEALHKYGSGIFRREKQ